ncbi:phytase [Russula earlei]|uniref:Phytase n=1 Tax=Russula earlei TaxID=71964 RepID=A0ACC0U1T0_9AGAM|nr:phytase [Russula earlei]
MASNDAGDKLPLSRRGRWCLAAALIFVSLSWLSFSWSWIARRAGPDVAIVTDGDIPDIGIPRSVIENWAQYSPYIPAGRYVPLPPGCIINQVNVLQRHGSRFPTTNAGKEIKATVKRLKRVKHYKEDYLKFLKDYTWDLGADDLIPLGAAQSFDAGIVAFERYKPIVTKDNPPFVRAAGSTRVVDSALNWTAGFRAAGRNTIKAKVDLILPETGNSTLDDGMCPNSADGDEESKTWLKLFASSIKKRLRKAAPGAKLTNKDVYNLMSLCAFHSQAKMAPSPFCGLFTANEFKDYEYHADLGKFYSNGHGGYLGPVQGVGYVNELLARLTGWPVRDNTQTNRTLDASEETFPLNRTLYADFTHDNVMVSIYSALGLFRQYLLPNKTLDPAKPSPLRTWIASKLVPFGTRMVVERLQCIGYRPFPKGVFVRILVNDALQPLEFCGGVAGMCELDLFVASQGYARHDGNGDFERCFDQRCCAAAVRKSVT